jgi:hypothetical protein
MTPFGINIFLPTFVLLAEIILEDTTLNFLQRTFEATFNICCILEMTARHPTFLRHKKTKIMHHREILPLKHHGAGAPSFLSTFRDASGKFPTVEGEALAHLK